MAPRLLAPLALVVALIAVLVVFSTSGTDSKNDGNGAAITTPAKTQTTKPTPKATKAKKTYTVRAGDTLGSISQKTGVSVSVLQELNPNLDPAALTVGETVKLKP